MIIFIIKRNIKITTEIQTPDSDDESQLSQRRIESETSDAESVRSELVGPRVWVSLEAQHCVLELDT